MAAYDVSRFTRSHSMLSFGTEPGFYAHHNIALIGTVSPSTIIPSCCFVATLAPDWNTYELQFRIDIPRISLWQIRYHHG